MRKIEFRGKGADTNEWVYGWFYISIESIDNNAIEYNYKKECVQFPYITDGENKTLVNINTVGEYIGVKDENGKKVYEGDVIEMFTFCNGKYVTEGIGVVEYDYSDASYGVGFRPLQWYLENTATEHPKAHFKVLGNIYDNKELINKITLKNPYSDLECVRN